MVEQNLFSDLKNHHFNCQTPGEWLSLIRKMGLTAPLEMMREIDNLMKNKNISFSEVFKLLVSKNKIFLIRNKYMFDLSALKSGTSLDEKIQQLNKQLKQEGRLIQQPVMPKESIQVIFRQSQKKIKDINSTSK